MKLDEVNEAEAEQILEDAAELGAEIVAFVEKARTGQINPRVVMTAMVCALGTQAARYAYRRMTKEELWSLITAEGVRGIFWASFDIEREKES